MVILEKRILSCLDVANYCLALLDRPLFTEEIEAWEQGSVVRVLRKTFGNFKDSAIPAPSEIDFELYDKEEKELIYKVYSVYGEHTASHLRHLTHEHSIWRDAIATDNKIINKQKRSEFFKRLINPEFFLISEEDDLKITVAEDQWWMNYDSGVPAEDVTNETLESIEELKAGKGIEQKSINNPLVW